MAPELTVQELLKTRIRQLVYVPTGREKAMGISTQGLIALDPRVRTPLARVLLHELIHVKRPMWSENKVLKEESRLWRKSTWREKAELYRLLGKGRVWEGEEEFDDEPSGGDGGGNTQAPVERADEGAPGEGLLGREPEGADLQSGQQ